MKREIIVNTNSLIKSKLPIDFYVMLQIIFEKDIELFNHYKLDLDGITALESLVRLEYLKYTGDSYIEEDLLDPTTIDILDFILLEMATKLFVNDKITEAIHEVDQWIGEYRNLFKGIKIGSMGDKNACVGNLKKFFKKNPKYTKEDVFRAAKYHIKNTNPTYILHADYFIYKTDPQKTVRSKLLACLEEMEIMGEVTDKSSLNKMI